MLASAARPIDDAETDERVNALIVIPLLHRTRLRQPNNPETGRRNDTHSARSKQWLGDF